MARTVKTSRKAKKTAPPTRQDADVAAPTVVERPDGYFWIGPRGHEEFGPYETFELAEAARDAVGDEAVAPGDALLQAEKEIGLDEWVDAETGEHAEGQSSPHLPEE